MPIDREAIFNGLKNISENKNDPFITFARLREVAEKVVELRNEAKVASRALMTAEDVAKLEARNIEKYGNPIGPTLDQLLEGGATYEEILESATSTNFWYNLFFMSF